ncbi:MAG: hypothetical protein GXZ18_07985 [Synergistaceae bacterium]|nr:hypothetical protein [Synergistaceae bacterium]
MSEIKYLIVEGKVSNIRLPQWDDPIYSKGLLFGITKMPKSSKPDDKETDLEDQKMEQENKELKGGI